MDDARPDAAGRADPVIRRALVSGDVTIDWHLARSRLPGDPGSAWSTRNRTEVSSEPGGAALLARLMDEVAAVISGDGFRTEVFGPTSPPGAVVPGDPRFHHAYATWSRHPRRRGDRDLSVWRVEEYLGIARARAAGGAVPVAGAGPRGADLPSDLVLIDDGGLGFRSVPASWPAVLRGSGPGSGPATGNGPWILLKMAEPVASGPLWRQLVHDHAERLIVLMSLEDLRRSDVRISRELSWERVAGEIAAEILRHPAVNSLVHAAHVVVSLGTGGAVLLSRPGPLADQLDRLELPDVHAVFDPEAIEDSWADQHPGGMIGNGACLAAGIARQLLLNPGEPHIPEGIRSGLSAVRALQLRGFGPGDDEPGPGRLVFPAADVARAIAADPAGFSSAPIELPLSPAWSILASRHTEGMDPIAEAVAFQGVEHALPGIPRARFGGFVTVDRAEIESYRSIRALLREYVIRPAPRPLSIAVFGPPGAGKSFGIKAVVKSVLDDGQVEVLTVNLSQLRQPSELADALHRARDARLRDRLPLVLWDEFDAELDGAAFGWLRHFLMPMQDGAFQDGELLHPIGASVFVFAGGTSARRADFAANRSAEFRMAKGPDFVSRLQGHVDVVGPDPREGDPEADPVHRIRRAILLRSILLRDRPGLFRREGGQARLQIDPGVLRAFLQVLSYRHGARSMESIIATSALLARDSYQRSALPSAGQLEAHVDAGEFLAIVERYVPDGELLERLAQAVHLEYCAALLEAGHPWSGTAGYLTEHPRLAALASRTPTLEPLPALVDFDRLPEDLREQNRDVARDVPRKLAELGYLLRQDAPAGAPTAVLDDQDPRVERLAREEHERWLRQRTKTGWRCGDRRDDVRRLHPSIRPWVDLPDEEREKDRLLVRKLPEIVAGAGMTLARAGVPAVAATHADPPETAVAMAGTMAGRG